MNRKIVWKDKKRILGMPISFTSYSMSEDRIFMETGVMTRKEEQILLYRIRDISTSISLFQRLLGVGNVTLASSDKTTPQLCLVNIAHPKEVAQKIHESVEEMKRKRGMRVGEMLESSFIDSDNFDFND